MTNTNNKTNNMIPVAEFGRLNMVPTLLVDWYKVEHFRQYPEGTEVIYSTFTPRSNKHAVGMEKVVFFGLQYYIKNILLGMFNEEFFNLPKEEAIARHERIVKNSLGNAYTKHIGELHDLGYLPIEIKALPEGTVVPMQVPVLTITNTHPDFFWLTNMLETSLSNALWYPSTTAAVSYQFRKHLEKYANITMDNLDGMKFLMHDFSMRGISSLESAMISGSSHLLSFVGEETVPATMFLEAFYNANVEEELVSSGIAATEHSVMSANSPLKVKEIDGEMEYIRPDEYDAYKRLLTEVYPNGPLSIVSDTYDFWKVVTETIPSLKEEILNRDGFLSVRPDSGDPADVLCGTIQNPVDGEERTVEEKGLIETLWEIFGGTVNKKGYKVLDSHIRAIYGDSITPDRALDIYQRLEKKGFSIENVVLASGSYAYTYLTRDTFGMAMKATHSVINGEEVPLMKLPKTDSGKASQRGVVYVTTDVDGELTYQDNLTLKEYEEKNLAETDLLQPVFKDGELLRETSLSEIRAKIDENVKKELQ